MGAPQVFVEPRQLVASLLGLLPGNVGLTFTVPGDGSLAGGRSAAVARTACQAATIAPRARSSTNAPATSIGVRYLRANFRSR